jgi:crossover junction endodeoxyribonuclease RusA
MLELELPYPPSINHYWRRVGARTLISREGRRFRGRVVAIVAALRPVPMNGSLEVEIDVYPPDRRRRDIDNLIKSVLDSLEHGGVYPDDSQVVHLTIRKQEPVSNGKCVVRVREV